YAKSMNPEVAIEVNPHGITGENRAWVAGLDHARFLKSTEVFWTEEENEPGYLPDGRLISKIRSYKLARAFDNILLAYITHNPVAMAECLAFDQTLGFVGEDPLPATMLQYISFYRKNREFYIGAKDAATVAVLRSYPSIAYHNAQAQLSAVLVEQALIQDRIPFDLIFDEHLANLSRYKVVILPGSECLSDQQLAAIRHFVENGGGLLATGEVGLYDEWRRVRVRRGLEGLVDSQPRAEAYQERVETAASAPSLPVRKEFGKGRVVYFPSVQYDGPLPEVEPYFSISNRFWKRPKNAPEISQAIHWANQGRLPVEISGPAFLVANLVTQPDKQRMMLHLVNYNARNMPSIRSVDVNCQLPQGRTVKEVKLIAPDSSNPEILKMTVNAVSVAFTVPEVKTYAVAVVSW
ncbi:MAG TPA: beta-galactosidase trimerization domain-containing protein, partial [Terriglobia bacterium]|nr:beta-galactosidase trimerization domain-containing protein [Terriglobia bacterium]